ncbi:Outer membrane protein assembly factor YaeT [hydrothermal vent metagenome]|uniref:Outer membrane protein assembly factor YaeT n=1 Tax=hydrothermal vent metagenome TaxID=652676 RepID=A0A3B0VDW5_9ZZZZ
MIKSFLLFTLLNLTTTAMAFESFEVEDIRLNGADRISHGTIFTYLPIEQGDTVSKGNISRAVKSLFRTGYFSDVKIYRDGNILVVKLVERPAIASIGIDGNKAIKTEELLKGLRNIGLVEGEVFDKLQLDRVQNELTKQYFSRGKYNVVVDAKIKELDRNRVKVNIEIEEGKAAKIKHIKIVGNTIFTDEELIDAFESDTTNFLSWYSSDDQYSKEKLNGDLEKLKSYYMDRGYVDFNVESVQVTISQDKKDIYITANIFEGKAYKFGEMKITGEMVLDKSSFERMIVSTEGQTFARNLTEASAERMKIILGNLGYAFAEITPVPEINKETAIVDMTYYIDPGKRVYVRNINFHGNIKTKDEVLRREMRQFEGGWYSKSLVERSKIRLQQKPYFEEVTIETPRVPGSDDQVDVEVTVKERDAGQFTFSVGFSQVSGINTNVSVSLQNLLGTGNTLSFAVNNSRFFKNLNVFYENPYYTDEGITRGFSMNYSTSNFGQANIARYSSSNGGFGMHVSFPITEYDRIYTSVAYERKSVKAFLGSTASLIFSDLCDLGGYAYTTQPALPTGVGWNGIDCLPEQPTQIPPDDPGGIRDGILIPYQVRKSFTFFKAEARWSRDSRNRFFNPTRGAYYRLGAEFALPGSTANFYKITAKTNKLFPLTKNLTLSISGEIGYGDGYSDTTKLPFFENFFAGGVSSLRGYRANTLGPKSTVLGDATSGNLPLTSRAGDPVGGSLKTLGSVELVFPTPFAKVGNAARLALFWDFGNVFNTFDDFEGREFRHSAGIALKWQAPVGPIIINFAVPFNDDKFDDTETIQFAFGNTF